MSIFFIVIIASNARLAAAVSGSLIASINARGTICQLNPNLSLHQLHQHVAGLAAWIVVRRFMYRDDAAVRERRGVEPGGLLGVLVEPQTGRDLDLVGHDPHPFLGQQGASRASSRIGARSK